MILKNNHNDPKLMQAWFGRFATQLDQGGASQLPEPLSADETASFEDFVSALQVETGLIRYPVCRFAYAKIDNEIQLYINGAIWDKFGADNAFIAKLANQSFLTQDEIESTTNNTGNLELLFDLWKLQFIVFIE